MDNNFNQDQNNQNPYSNPYTSYEQQSAQNMDAAYEIKRQQELQNKQGLAVAALVLGILSILCCCVGFGWVFGIVGLILGIVSLVQHKGGKGMAIGGVVTSAISIVLSVVMIIYFFVVFGAIGITLKDLANPEGWEKIMEDSAEDYYKENGEYPDFYYEYHMDEDGWFKKYVYPVGGAKLGDSTNYTYCD